MFKNSPLSLILFIIIMILMSLSFFNTAWVAEDAFITFRSVNQLLAGEGAVWNLGERVQVYTHPLWYGLLVLGTAVFGDSYYFVLALSWCCLLGVVLMLCKLANQYAVSKIHYVFLLVLPLSRAFVDYSSSGLENPLVHLLMCAYVLFWLREDTLSKRFFYTSLIYGLVYLTRPDAIFILTPASLYLFVQMVKNRQAWFKCSVLSIVPVLVWELFSIVYYGSFIPNTALAKVNIAYERSTLWQQAHHYFVFNWDNDTLTLSVIALAAVVVWFNQRLISKLIMLGVLIQMAYITHVGADYMLGRFLSPSVLMSVMALLLSQFAWQAMKRATLVVYGLTLVFLFGSQATYTLFPHVHFSDKHITAAGLADERAYYFQDLGLLPSIMLDSGKYYLTPIFQKTFFTPQNNVTINCNIGQYGWTAAPELYIIDPLALSDPFLSRLPATTSSRVGHYERAFPVGFVASRLTGHNQLQDPLLKQLYDDVTLVTRGEIWQRARFQAIWRLNTGYYRHVAQHHDRNAVGLDFDSPRKITRSICSAPLTLKKQSTP